MKFKFTVDTDEIDEDYSFEDLFSGAMRKEISAAVQKDILSNEFKKFSALVSDTIVADTKLRMSNFLSEEIALTSGYGEKTFVGSIEDLIKKRFDDVLLRSVDLDGQTLKGCTSKGNTWVEWQIKNMLKKTVDIEIKRASDKIEREISDTITDELTERTAAGIKEKVTTAFKEILDR